MASQSSKASAGVHIKPQAFSNMGAFYASNSLNNGANSTKALTGSSSFVGEQAPNKERITSKEFNDKVYSRFEKFMEEKDEKIRLERNKNKQKKKISTKDFETKVLQRFDHYTKDSEARKVELERKHFIEMTGQDPEESNTVTLEEFQNGTLTRFQVYEEKARANKERLE